MAFTISTLFIDLAHQLSIFVGIEFTLQALIIHVSHVAKNCPFCPGTVMLPKTPCNTRKPIWISAVQLIFIVQISGWICWKNLQWNP